jgi:class 3 adenylate cyclase/ActR/RegA family two-component response regulator
MMESKKELIMLVDDNPTNLRAGKNVLGESYAVVTAPSAEKMFALLENNIPALIILDIDMPGMNGYEAIRILKKNPETKNIPVIFLTGKTDTENEIEGLDLGAIDYIIKPFVPPLLLKRIETHLLVETQKKNLEKQALELRYFNENLHKAFSTYLSEDVVNELISNPTRLQLGGMRRHISAIFTDIQGFSGTSERLEPYEIVYLLNQYLTAMSDVILDQKGTIDKFNGDAIMAFFGAPLELADHALRTCVSAIMMKKREEELNRKLAGENVSPMHFLTRIGINTGDMIVGNMGTKRKMNYTIMGGAVNLASRLEGINKQYGTWILASETTVKEAGNAIVSRRLDRIRAVGLNGPVCIYEILALADEVSPAVLELIETFHAALGLFEKRDWSAAGAAFAAILERAPADGPSKLYLERCRQYRQTPPSPDWDGVFNFDKK